MSRKVIFAPGEYYHVYSRGTEKRRIFLSKKDCDRFLVLLYLANSSEPLHLDNMREKTFEEIVAAPRSEVFVDLCAYCLMPNHFHLLVREISNSGASRFLQKLLTAYTMYFNIRNDRTGTLFSGRYKAHLANRDEYLKYLIAYIHLNPVKLIDPLWKESGIRNRNEAERFLSSYRYSSYLDLCGKKRPERALINITALPEYFTTTKNFTDEIRDWLTFKESNTLHNS